MYQEQGVNHVTGILLFNFAEREGLQSTSLYFVLRASPASMSSPAVPLGTLSTGPRSHLVLPGNRTLVLRTGFSSDRPLYQIQKTPSHSATSPKTVSITSSNCSAFRSPGSALFRASCPSPLRGRLRFAATFQFVPGELVSHSATSPKIDFLARKF
jgi:hypothetical protein